MAKKTVLSDDQIIKALPNDPEIKQEYDRILALFTEAHPATVELYRKVIARAAFTGVICDRLERDIAKNGYQQAYNNGGGQSGFKKSTAADLLPNYTKLYLSCMKQLREAMNPEAGRSEPDDLVQWLAARERDGGSIPQWAEKQLEDLDEFETFDLDYSRKYRSQEAES